MLIRITNCCTMGCTHCLIEASHNGAHMAFNTYLMALNFLRSLDAPVVFLSGGEPTENPNLLTFLSVANTMGLKVLLMSNGLFLANEELREQVLPQVWGVQVTNDPRFYPDTIKVFPHPKVKYENQIRQVAPFGRALTNKLLCNRLTPYCFNLRSCARSFGNVGQALAYLWGLGKFCTPSINPDGTVVAGEASSCHPIGTVWDSPETVTRNLCDMRCNRCGLVLNLDKLQQEAIGEAP